MDKFYLDYSIRNYHDRLSYVQENFNLDDINQRYLEYISDYLLSSKDMKEMFTDGIKLKSKASINNNKREITNIPHAYDEDGHAESNAIDAYTYVMKFRDVKQVNFRKKSELTQKEILENEFLSSYQLSILNLDSIIKDYTEIEDELEKDKLIYLAQLKRIKKDIKYEMKLTKTLFDKPIQFKSISESQSDILDEVVNFRDVNHVVSFIKNYRALKKQSENTTDSKLKFLIWEFEDLISELSEEDKEALNLFFYEYTYESIKEQLGLSSQHIAHYRINKYIPSRIAKIANENHSIWYHDNVLKGKFKKKCKSCQLELPENEIFFYARYKKESGYVYNSKCIKCLAKDKK